MITDFGIPKVIGGNFNVLATDVFKLVIGQQDFRRGRWWRCCCWPGGADLRGGPLVVSAADRHADRPRGALSPAPAPCSTPLMGLYCWAVRADAGDAGHGGVRLVRQLLALQPAPSLRHYVLGLVDAEVGEAFVNSLLMAGGTAVFGTLLVFVGAYLLEKTRVLRGRAVRCGCWRCCRWRCRGWCWAWATSSSSTRRPTR